MVNVAILRKGRSSFLAGARPRRLAKLFGRTVVDPVMPDELRNNLMETYLPVTGGHFLRFLLRWSCLIDLLLPSFKIWTFNLTVP